MSTLNFQVKSEGPEHLLVITAILQSGVTQEVFETHAPSAFQVGYFMVDPVYFVFEFPYRIKPQCGYWASIHL